MGIFSISINKPKLLIFITVTILLVLWWMGKITYACPIKSYTTLNCAMCRSTRAVKLLLNFKFIESIKMNPMALIWSYFVGLFYIKLALETLNIRVLQNILNFKRSSTKYTFVTMTVLNILYLNIL